MRKTMKGMDMPIYIVFHNYCVSQPDKGRTYLYVSIMLEYEPIREDKGNNFLLAV